VDRTTDWANKKNMVKSMRWTGKIGEEILVGQNKKEKREIKTGNDFLADEN
jgi:hypothetical protein